MENFLLDEYKILIEFENDRYGRNYVPARKLKVQWTSEMAQDLQFYHAIDAGAELTALLSEEITREIDREIFNIILNENNINQNE